MTCDGDVTGDAVSGSGVSGDCFIGSGSGFVIMELWWWNCGSEILVLVSFWRWRCWCQRWWLMVIPDSHSTKTNLN